MEEKELIPFSDLVKIDNKLARGMFTLKTAREYQCFFMIVKKIAEKISTNKGENFKVEFPVTEIDNALGGSGYDWWRKVPYAIVRTAVGIEDPELNEIIAWPVFSECRYRKGIIYAEMQPKFTELIIALEKNFTQFSMPEFLQLRGRYGQRLFMLLMSFVRMEKFKKCKTFSADEIQNLLQIPQSKRKTFTQTEQIIARAQKEIVKKTKLNFFAAYEKEKRGRRISKVLFYFLPFSKTETEKIKSDEPELFENIDTEGKPTFLEMPKKLK